MKLLLLGCTGFIGKEIVPKLISGDHKLTLITRQKHDNLIKVFTHENIQKIQLDPSLPASWENPALLEVLRDSEGIINLAGEPIAEKRWNKSQCRKIEASRLDTTKHLIKAMNEVSKPADVLINASAIGFYGTSSDAVFTENSEAGNDFLANLCNQWENLAAKKPNSTRLVTLRLGIVIEKDGGALGKMLPIFRAGLGGPIGSGKQWMSWIHRSDLCEIINQAITNKAWRGTFNAVAPNPVSMAQFAKTLGKILQRPTLLKVPGPILKVLLGDGAKVVLEGQKVISKNLKNLNFQFQYPEIALALNAISKRSL